MGETPWRFESSQPHRDRGSHAVGAPRRPFAARCASQRLDSETGTAGDAHGPATLPTILIRPEMRPLRYWSWARSLRVLVPEENLIDPLLETFARGLTLTCAGPTKPPSSQT